MYKKKLKLVTFLLTLVLILSQAAVFAEDSDNFAVEILGGEKDLKLSLEDLKAMPEEAQIHEEYIYNSKSGQKTVTVKGISLAYVLKELAGVTEENAEVIFEASDGYPIDPQTLADIMDEDLRYVLAYETDGQVINNDDNPDNGEIVVYRKVKEEGEFGTVFKLVEKITIGQAPDTTEETVEEEEKEEKEEVAEEITFIDITEEYEYAKAAIEALAAKGIIDGVGDGKYAPEQEFTRGQFCKIIIDALGYEKAEYNSDFTDVEAGNWFAPYVETAVEKGLFIGYTDNSFKPNQVITRQEMAAVVGRSAILAERVEEAKMAKFTMEKSKFEDKDLVPNWAEKEVAWLEAQGVFAEIARENFEPVKVVNRAEAAIIVYNTLFNE